MGNITVFIVEPNACWIWKISLQFLDYDNHFDTDVQKYRHNKSSAFQKWKKKIGK